MMNKLLLAKNYKMEVKIPLEKRYVEHVQESKVPTKTIAKKGTVKEK